MYNWIKQLKGYLVLNIKDNRTTYIFFCIGIYVVLILAGLTKKLFLTDNLQFLPINTVLIIFTGITFIVAELVVDLKLSIYLKRNMNSLYCLSINL